MAATTFSLSFKKRKKKKEILPPNFGKGGGMTVVCGHQTKSSEKIRRKKGFAHETSVIFLTSIFPAQVNWVVFLFRGGGTNISFFAHRFNQFDGRKKPYTLIDRNTSESMS
jgi:hypothetical protein